MEEMKISRQIIFKYYLKRWSSLSVKLLRIESVIIETSNSNTQIYLREYAKQVEKDKADEKENVIKFCNH